MKPLRCFYVACAVFSAVAGAADCVGAGLQHSFSLLLVGLLSIAWVPVFVTWAKEAA